VLDLRIYIVAEVMTFPLSTTMSSLPKIDSDLERRLFENPNLISAYIVCLKHEKDLSLDNEVRRIRILGYLLLFLPKQETCVYLARSISYCSNEPEILVELGHFFEKNVILPCELPLISLVSEYPLMFHLA
jgi:hypothetical protein